MEEQVLPVVPPVTVNPRERKVQRMMKQRPAVTAVPVATVVTQALTGQEHGPVLFISVRIAKSRCRTP
jgi:hypothetical protein